MQFNKAKKTKRKREREKERNGERECDNAQNEQRNDDNLNK